MYEIVQMSTPQYTRSIGRGNTLHYRNYRTLEELKSEGAEVVNGILKRLSDPEEVAKADKYEIEAYKYRGAILIRFLPQADVTIEMVELYCEMLDCESLELYKDDEPSFIGDYRIVLNDLSGYALPDEVFTMADFSKGIEQHFDRAEASFGSYRHQKWLRSRGA